MTMELSWLAEPVKVPCQKSRQRAAERQAQLTKPPGSLGQLEQIAIDFCGWQQTDRPVIAQPAICVFAADHGVVAEGVSAFPQQVTAQMVNNFGRGGAAITVLARQLKATFKTVNLGTIVPADDFDTVVNLALSSGSENFLQAPAMSEALYTAAVQAGRDYCPASADLFIAGDMGIGNTTAAAALICAYTGIAPEQIVGRGTGIDDQALFHKCEIVARALRHHSAVLSDATEVLRCLGGLEIAAMAAAYVCCAQRGIPSLIDGFIATAAALAACRINPGVRDWLLFSHQSAELGHRLALQALEASPILNAGLRLGEGSGAALAVPVVQMALVLHNEMATFAEAGVSEGE